MQDASGADGSGEGAFSDGVTYALVDGGAALEVSLDRGWLDDVERVYPVRVDPSFVVGVSQDTYVQSNAPNTDFSTNDRLSVGSWTLDSVRRSFVGFDVDELDGMQINHAAVRVHNRFARTCDAKQMRVRRVTEAWDASAARWPGPAMGEQVGAISESKGATGCPAGFFDVRVTRAVQRWVDGESAAASRNKATR